MQPLKIVGWVLIIGALIKGAVIGFYMNEAPFLIGALLLGAVFTKIAERTEG